MEPWRQLLHGCASASDSILLSPDSDPFTGCFNSLRQRHYLNAYFSFVAILCESLIVALANIPFKPGLAFIAYKSCTYIAIAILSLMLIGLTWMLSLKRSPGLMVRKPEKLAEVMIALCGSQMLEDFEGMSTLGTRERDAIINTPWEGSLDWMVLSGGEWTRMCLSVTTVHQEILKAGVRRQYYP